MKKHVLLLLALLAALTLLTACGTEPADTPDASDSLEAVETTDIDSLASSLTEVIRTGFAIAIEGEAKFVIVRPEKATKGEIALATGLREFIKENTGVALDIKDDWIKKGQKHDPETFEILVGSTNYDETAAVKKDAGKLKMVAEIRGNKIVLYSGNDLGYYTIAESLADLLTPYCTPGTLIIPKDFSYSEYYRERLAGLPLYDGEFQEIKRIDCGDENTMLYLSGTNNKGFTSYCTALEEAGFTRYTSRTAANNQYATYTDKDQVVNVYYTKSSRELRIIEEPTCALPPRAEDVKATEAVCTPAVMMVGQEFYRVEESDEPTGNALGLIFRLSDGRLIIVDGGMPSKVNPDILLKAMREIAPNQFKITVAAWILTHVHSDHVEAFCSLYKNGLANANITVENLIYNFAVKDAYIVPMSGTTNSTRDESDGWGSVQNAKLPGTNVIKAHSGQLYHYGDATVEMLYTIEDYYPAKFTYVNTTSLAFRITLGGQSILILGDLSEAATPILVRNYGSYLKSDIVQIAHHGYDGGTVPLYNAIQAKVALWPGGYYHFPGNYTSKPNQAALGFAEDLFVAGNKNHLLELPYTTVGNKEASIADAKAKNAILKQEIKDRRHK